MELDRALEFAAILAWEDFSKVAAPTRVRVECDFGSHASVEHLRIWVIKPKGYQDLAYEYRAEASRQYPAGPRFANGHGSQALTRALTFILGNQGQFSRAADSNRRRILVNPPSEAEYHEATTWMRGLSIGGRADLAITASENVPGPALVFAR